MPKTLDMEQWREAIKKKSQLIHRVGQTDDGKAMLAMLKTTFCDKSLFNESATVTARNIGQRDVVQYLIELAENMDNE
jgi:hypothetical protein